MISALLMLMAALEAPPQSVPASYTPEQLAEGAIREIVSAQAYHKSAFPALGFACSIDRLVAVQALGDVWLTGKRVDGYSFRVWCKDVKSPQAGYRASAVPTKKAKGSLPTVCTDETNVPRAIDGDVQACFARGATPQR